MFGHSYAFFLPHNAKQRLRNVVEIKLPKLHLDNFG